MMKIITTSELQKKIGQLIAFVQKGPVIVTNRGSAKVIMLPYFDENTKAVEDYLEDYEMYMNKDALEEEYKGSHESGESDLVI